ncbi:hypothetical protein LRB11_15995 [Ectothiorhodospira haloalkaliphila]|uniref:helicase-related protein n=1 Tax=Ectothiorhodospira haloalkaliphila TaxID=421628 RepID=UPI001EE91812|nr:helicase-related protein [Ectothiorhodospira haloalkaliphila]MCG5526413.1 hypothetical protein [Ectothiorhodospira haloalkaliphila]
MDWDKVEQRLNELANLSAAAGQTNFPMGWQINDGQRASLHAIAKRLSDNGVIIADEVGMGKTRIVAGVARAVVDCGGRVAILVPPGLGYQWRDELHGIGVSVPPILRSLWQYFAAWAPKQSTTPQPWFDESAILISHSFTNWRLGANSRPWRWALLPEVYACWRQRSSGRYPRCYHDNEILIDDIVKSVAEEIVSAAAGRRAHGAREMRNVLDRLLEETPWPGALDAAEYEADASLRPGLERAVGLGLGMFDLVIIDEAHKSRGDSTMLGRLLEGVIQTGKNARRIAMTATPVELDASQWKSMLLRIQLEDDSITELVNAFSEAVRKVRNTPSDPAASSAYLKAARDFKTALTPYLLRRDKRQDPSVIAFQRYSGLPLHEYRREREILVDPMQVSNPWRQVICAAESLSFATRGMNDSVARSLRLTMGNGHGIATLMGHAVCDSETDPDLEAELLTDPVPSESGCPTAVVPEKRDARVRWWKDLIVRHSGTDRRSLLDHPAILAAVKAIEEADGQGEKVLVFGRFVRPLQELVHLLNARAMLSSLRKERLWPQSKISDAEWPAVEAAHKQLFGSAPDRQMLDDQLEQQYRKLEDRRRDLRKHLLQDIERGLVSDATDTRLLPLFAAFRAMVEVENEHPEPSAGTSTLALVARSILELLPDRGEPPTPDLLAGSFAELVDALTERDEGLADDDTAVEAEEAKQLWEVIRQRIEDDHTGRDGSFARLMYGNTPPQTRRLLQLGFNRLYSWPRVLVCQSQVGREGLNLHRACRIVVLLHPEWNPGVVEQQIGRVDRVGSHWERLCGEAIAENCPPTDLPRIEVRPLVFRGTYDEWNWEVLRRRWEELRAQLHGVIISSEAAEKYSGMEELLREIESAAPNFYPE